jgi:hypothetical protein
LYDYMLYFEDVKPSPTPNVNLGRVGWYRAVSTTVVLSYQAVKHRVNREHSYALYEKSELKHCVQCNKLKELGYGGNESRWR